MLLAAGASSPEPELLAAAGRLRVSTHDLQPAVDSGLVTLQAGRARFRHTLVIPTLLHEASAGELASVHAALADVCADAVRAAWHRAAAVPDRDDAVADALEAVALDDARRGARAEAVAALRRAAALSGTDARRAQRLAWAAEAAREGGLTREAADALREGFHVAADPAVVRELTITEWVLSYSTGVTAGHTIDDMVEASRAVGISADMGTGEGIGKGMGEGLDGLRVLLAAATRVWAFPASAAEAGRVRAALLGSARVLPAPGSGLKDHADGRSGGEQGGAEGGPAHEPSPESLERALRTVGLVLLDATATPAWERAALAGSVAVVAKRHPSVLPAVAFAAEAAQDLSTAAAAWDTGVRFFHANGSVGDECLALAGRAGSLIDAGLVGDGLADAQLSMRMASDLGLPLLAGLAAAAATRARAWLGSQGTGEEITRWAYHLIDEEPPCRLGRARGAWAMGLSALADDRPADALVQLRRVALHETSAHWALADLVEAGVAAGDTTGLLAQVETTARAAELLNSQHLRLLVHRAQALLVEDPAKAEHHHRAAVVVGRRSGTPLEMARGLLSYAQWLGQRGRRGESTQQAAAAVDLFHASAAAPWAQRAQALM
ncbi:hypothetical protein FHR75_004448 [Kineococcus radiotolerans]|uniref:Uncharacterized protein n=1 Tax=Kineococcus radiotolerans TaxID=131568 RepID=A0A7W4TR76_KINRA|nr:hypothetical protein [Kineococcus radiotolerans]MBB2903605.1 hypothetical protein [Kineococcus radiotolerans]